MMRVGILGGGQLGRMLALAGYPLGVRFRILDPSPEAPAGHLAELIIGDYEDPEAVARFADGLDVATYEFENLPAAAVDSLAARLPVFPPPGALRSGQDRLAEKELFRRLDIPTTNFASIDDRAGFDTALRQVGTPAVLKTRRLGYDGKGQRVVRGTEDVEAAWDALGQRGPLILERFVDFGRELSIIAVRGRGGETRCYPLVENLHADGILRRSLAPAAGTGDGLQALAEGYVGRLLEALDYVGVLAVELFEADGALLANEFAPRVHNSGHWTIEGAVTSQFENHLRAVLGLPLGATDPIGHSGMLNIIGETPDPTDVLAVPGAHLHLYGKSQRPGRKLGHITVTGADADVVGASLARLAGVH